MKLFAFSSNQNDKTFIPGTENYKEYRIHSQSRLDNIPWLLLSDKTRYMDGINYAAKKMGLKDRLTIQEKIDALAKYYGATIHQEQTDFLALNGSTLVSLSDTRPPYEISQAMFQTDIDTIDSKFANFLDTNELITLEEILTELAELIYLQIYPKLNTSSSVSNIDDGQPDLLPTHRLGEELSKSEFQICTPLSMYSSLIVGVILNKYPQIKKFTYAVYLHKANYLVEAENYLGGHAWTAIKTQQGYFIIDIAQEAAGYLEKNDQLYYYNFEQLRSLDIGNVATKERIASGKEWLENSS